MKSRPKQAGKEKNQLITKSSKERRPKFVWPIIAVGASVLIVSVVWAIALCIRAAPPRAWFYDPPGNMEWGDMLFEWSHFGHAILGPLELATLGTIVLSFVHVLHQMRAQEHTEKTRFQPVITCVALLDYSLEGTEQKEKVRVSNPLVRLRIRNLGNSPATFIDLTVEEFAFKIGNGEPINLSAKLKSDFFQIDSLGEHAGGINGTQYDLDLTSKDLDARVTELINGILSPDSNQTLGELVLTLGITHENVMGLGYTRKGTFVWSLELGTRDRSDREQTDYIEEFRSARASNDLKDGAIGKLIKRSHPLQAFLTNVKAGPRIKKSGKN